MWGVSGTYVILLSVRFTPLSDGILLTCHISLTHISLDNFSSFHMHFTCFSRHNLSETTYRHQYLSPTFHSISTTWKLKNWTLLVFVKSGCYPQRFEKKTNKMTHSDHKFISFILPLLRFRCLSIGVHAIKINSK